MADERGNGLFGVYVHWPFCMAKCPYCDFNSHVHRGAFDEAAYVEAYTREIAHFAAQTQGRTVQSIFFGGGTPSLMDPRSVASILDAIAAHWSVAPKAEITLEASAGQPEMALIAEQEALSAPPRLESFRLDTLAVGARAHG
jgi:oxygen-independent coproporphyrinogen-3 oxidase